MRKPALRRNACVVHPERVDALVGMQLRASHRSSLASSRRCVRRARLRLQHGVEPPQPRVVDVGLGRHDVEVAGEHDAARRTAMHSCACAISRSNQASL